MFLPYLSTVCFYRMSLPYVSTVRHVLSGTTRTSGIIAQCSFADLLLGRLTSYLRGDFIEDINDHALSEYVRLLKQIVINSKVSVLDKATSVVMDAIMSATRKVKTGMPPLVHTICFLFVCLSSSALPGGV